MDTLTGTKLVQKQLWTHLFPAPLWTRNKFWTGRGGDERRSSIPNSKQWSLNFGRNVWLAVKML
jgi:hypothetical protein